MAMDFKESFLAFAEKSVAQKDKFVNEESTKMGLIVPFFNLLGYNVFDPSEFMPEYDAGVFGVKDAKVDYAIIIDDKPVIVIEAKPCGMALEDKHCSQLFKYFATTPARFAILTNGLIYKFYSDIDDRNKMDEDPFLEIDLQNPKRRLIPALERFCRSSFQPDELFSEAEELKYLSTMRKYLDAEQRSPSDEFVRFFSDYVYKKKKTQAAIEKFRPIVQKAFNTYIEEQVTERLTSALNRKPLDEPSPVSEGVGVTASASSELPVLPDTKAKIITTDEEIEAYNIIRALLHNNIGDVKRLSYKDTTQYFSILWITCLRTGYAA